MKKIFCFVAAALVSLSALAVDGVNVMASGLKATFNDDVTEMTIDYVLNTAATSLEVEFFDADEELVSLVELQDAALLTAGAHQTTIEIPLDDFEAGVITWGIHAYGATTVFENKLSIDDLKYKFYLPQDVVVDNSFESEYFGRVYVGESTDGASDGMTATTKTQTRGIFIYDTQMNLADGQNVPTNGYDGGLGGDRANRQAFKRLSVDDEGYVYVSSRDAATKGVYRMDPANPSANFATVLSASVTVDGVETAKGKLYTLEGMSTSGGNFNTYDLSTIPVAEPTASSPTNPLMLANSDATLRSDRKKGFWATQYRSSPDDWSALVHFSKNGVPNYFINGTENTDLLSKTESEYSYRGVMGVNRDGSIIAVGSDGCAKVFSVEWGEDGAPVLSKLCSTPFLAANIDGIAFDAADNMYVLSARVEQLYLFPIAKENSNSRVMAASRYAFVVEGDDPGEEIEHVYELGDNQIWEPDKGIELTKNEDGTFSGTFEFTNTTTYFAFVTMLGTSADWDLINDHRYAGETSNLEVKGGDVLTLVKKNDCFTAAPGTYTFVLDMENMLMSVTKEETAVENINTEAAPTKVLREGQVLIRRNGAEYNVLGTELK